MSWWKTQRARLNSFKNQIRVRSKIWLCEAQHTLINSFFLPKTIHITNESLNWKQTANFSFMKSSSAWILVTHTIQHWRNKNPNVIFWLSGDGFPKVALNSGDANYSCNPVKWHWNLAQVCLACILLCALWSDQYFAFTIHVSIILTKF